MFTNPANDANAAASGYVAALLALLGERNPLAVMDELPGALRSLVATQQSEALGRQEAEGKWSALETIQHLADTEIVYGYRVRLVLAEDRPHLPGYDQDVWARRLHYGTGDVDAVIEEIEVARRRNLRLFRSLGASELARVGLHAERGPESVARIVQLVAGHDLVHRRQIARVLTGSGQR
jgi:hypothetical protein